jgi:hypothetical protein
MEKVNAACARGMRGENAGRVLKTVFARVASVSLRK